MYKLLDIKCRRRNVWSLMIGAAGGAVALCFAWQVGMRGAEIAQAVSIATSVFFCATWLIHAACAEARNGKPSASGNSKWFKPTDEDMRETLARLTPSQIELVRVCMRSGHGQFRLSDFGRLALPMNDAEVLRQKRIIRRISNTETYELTSEYFRFLRDQWDIAAWRPY